MRRWARATALSLLGAVIALYAGDFLVFNLCGSRTDRITVSHFLSAPLKNNKEELDYLGSEEEVCSVSLFRRAAIHHAGTFAGTRTR